jgi:hypothetical protein
MSDAQKNTLRTMQAVEDTSGRYLDAGCYDGRVLPALVSRGLAEVTPTGLAMITPAGYRALRDAAETVTVNF